MIAITRISGLLLFFLLLCCFTSIKAQDWTGSAAAFPEVNQIQLKKTNGKKTSVSNNNALLQLFVFLSPECPLCKNYSAILNALQQKFAKDVQLIGIVPGKSYSKGEVQQFVKDYNILFPVYIDPAKAFTNYTKATTTPEAIVVDNKGKLIYRGAIDDWVQELGKKKIKPEQFYVEQALEQFLQGKPVQIKTTLPIGCLINEF